MVKNSPAMQETQIRSLGQEDPLRREGLVTPVSLLGGFHGLRCLGGHSLWGHRELDTTEQLMLSLSLWSESCSVVSNSFRSYELHSPWNSPGQNTGVGSLSPLQGIFLSQGSNPGLPHCRRILDQLSHKGSPRILEWVAYPCSSGSSQPRNWTGVSCIAGRFSTNWAMREALRTLNKSEKMKAIKEL